MTAPLATPKVQQPPPPESAPVCCTQRTITVPGEVDVKSRQRHYWGSHDWVNAFSRRSRVEGWFGNLKNENTEALSRGAFRVMGLCKTSLMLGIYAAATNLRLLRAWARRNQHDDDLVPLLTAGDTASADPRDVSAASDRADRPPPRGS